MTGSIKINVINEIKNDLEMIETEKNYDEIIVKNNDEIIDFVEVENDNGKNIDEISKGISPESILYEKWLIILHILLFFICSIIFSVIFKDIGSGEVDIFSSFTLSIILYMIFLLIFFIYLN